jgi:hypothetical protein
MATRFRRSNTRDEKAISSGLDPNHERLTELERRSLLAEQAREQAHRLRSPLSVIELISETLQLEVGEEPGRAERLQRVLDAVSTLSMNLTQSVRSNRFAEGPKRPLDVAQVAAKVVLAFGGRVDAGVSMSLEGAARSTEDTAVVLAEEQGFQAALVHLLRLIGVGHTCNGVCTQLPLLSVEQDEHAQRLRLRLTSEGDPELPIPAERADYQLMLKAVERVVRDSDGALVLGQDHATLELPFLEPWKNVPRT